MKILFEFPYYPVIDILVKIKYQIGVFLRLFVFKLNINSMFIQIYLYHMAL